MDLHHGQGVERAIPILDVGGVDHDLKEVTQRIHDNVALTATDFLAGVVAEFSGSTGG